MNYFLANYIDHINKNATRFEVASKPIADSIAEEFSTSRTYAVGDYVMREYKLYKCISAVTTAGSWVANKWQECKITGEFQEIANEVEDNVMLQIPAVDDTLSVQGAAADAKKTGDEIAALKDDLSELNKVFSDTPESPETSSSGWRLNESDGLCSQNIDYKLVKYKVIAGDCFKVVSDDRFQFQTEDSVPSTVPNKRVGSTYKNGTFVVTVPASATYLIVSTPTTSNAKVYKQESTVNERLSECVRFTPQSLTDAQKTQARTNIGIENVDGLSENVKQAILDCVYNVAWKNVNGKMFYNNLYYALYPSKSYVTNGLVVYFDGINNTGDGHDETATRWVDIVNGYVMSFTEQSNTRWNEKGLVLAGNEWSNQGLISSGRLWTPNANTTIEVVMKCEATGKNQSVLLFDPDATSDSNVSVHKHICLYSDGTIGFVSTSNKTYINPEPSATDIKHISVLYNNYTVDSVYINDKVASIGQTTHSYRMGKAKEYIGYGDSTNYDMALKGEIYAIRLYNRHLTAEELARNLAYDNTRFNLEL